MTQRHLERVLSLAGCFLFAGLLFGQQADRAIITALVTDALGAAVPQADVAVINESTNVRTEVTTSSDGNYSTPPLVLGTYTVEAKKEGFKTFVQKGILPGSGAVYRQDAALEVGSVTERVEVTAAPEMVNASTPAVSNVINERYYRDLPVIASQDMRLPEALLYAQPGFVPTPVTNFASLS